MFGKSPFYFASCRKVLAVFGSMFNDIRVQRSDIEGAPVKIFTVPIEFAQKEHYITKLREDESRNSGSERAFVAITLPRMAYEFTGMTYRPEAKRQSSKYISTPKDTNTDTSYKMHNPVPYTMAIELSVFTRNLDDILQIMEQILPFFTPSIAVTINEVPQLGLKNDVVFELVSVATPVEVEGPFANERVLSWSMQFIAKMNIYHPVSDPKIIKKAISNIDIGDVQDGDDDSIDVIITQMVDPLDADKGDMYTVIKTVEEFE